MNIFPFNLAKNTEELKCLITEHPDYPIVVLVGIDSSDMDHMYTYCKVVHFKVTEILDCEVPWNEETVYEDKDEFKECMEDWLWYEMKDTIPNLSEEKFEEALKEELAKYEPYWKKVIAIYADN